MYAKKDGSISVWLAFVFIIIFSLITGIIDICRYQSAKTFSRVASYNAARIPLGDYNKELYNDFGLLSYGGYKNKNSDELTAYINTLLSYNIKEAPEKKISNYAKIHSFNDISAYMVNTCHITEEKEFFREIKHYLGKEVISDAFSLLSGANPDSETIEKNLKDEVNQGEDYFNNKESSDSKNNNDKDNNKKENNDNSNKNLLKIMLELLKTGVLSMVMDVSALSNKELKIRKIDNTDLGERSDKDLKFNDLKKIKKNLKTNEEAIKSTDKLLEKRYKTESDYNPERLTYLYFANNELDNYTDSDKDNICMMEYVIGGNKNIKSNMLNVVARIFFMRLAINMVTVFSDEDLKEKSTATGETIGLLTVTPELSQVYANIILFFYSLEETMIDTSAIMQNRAVPLIKKSKDLKLDYAEMTKGNPVFFKKKAESYEESKGVIHSLKSGLMDYTAYLDFFLLFMNKEKLVKRTCEIIEYDLNRRYDTDFNINESITAYDLLVRYNIDFFFVNTGDKMLGDSFIIRDGYYLE